MILIIYQKIRGFMEKIRTDNLNAFSAQAAFFIILSMFPFILLLLHLIKYTNITKSMLLNAAVTFLPSTFNSFATTIIDELYTKTGSALLSASALTALWSSSKGMIAIIHGLDSVYDVEETRSYFRLRFISIVYTIMFSFSLILSLGLLVFGNAIFKTFQTNAPLLYDVLKVFAEQKTIISFCLLTVFFTILYKAVPNKALRFINLLPGAVFTGLGWVLFSFAYSIYVSYSSNLTYTYGSLTMIILLMLWLYICMYILFIGAEINVYLNQNFQMFATKNVNDDSNRR